MDRESLHRIEHLEAEVRRLRQCLRILYDAVIAGDEGAAALAEQTKALLEGR